MSVPIRPSEIPVFANTPVLLSLYDNTLLDDDRWQQNVLAGIAGADKIAPGAFRELPVGGRNWVANGTFVAWNNGTSMSASGTSIVRAADGWRIAAGSCVRDTSTFSYNGLGMDGTTGECYVIQIIRNVQELRGRTVGLTAVAAGAGAARIVWGDDGGGVGASSTDTPGTTRTMHSLGTVSSTATFITVALYSTTGYVAYKDVMLTRCDGPPRSTTVSSFIENFQDGQRFRDYLFSMRFHSTAAFEIETVHFTFPVPLLHTPTGDWSLTGNNTGTNDVTLFQTPGTTLISNLQQIYLSTADQLGCDVQFAAAAGNTDTYILNALIRVNLADN